MAGLMVAWLGVAAIGCGAPSATQGPAPAPWTPPPDWVTVSTSDGSLQLTLPPWLGVFDNSGAILANEPPGPAGVIPMQLMAIAPEPGAGPQAGDDLVAWLESRVAARQQGVPTVTRVTLPAGPAVRYDRTDMAGDPTAWRILAFAIETRSGVAFLQIDGPLDGWPERLGDLERIPFLLRVR